MESADHDIMDAFARELNIHELPDIDIAFVAGENLPDLGGALAAIGDVDAPDAVPLAKHCICCDIDGIQGSCWVNAGEQIEWALPEYLLVFCIEMFDAPLNIRMLREH